MPSNRGAKPVFASGYRRCALISAFFGSFRLQQRADSTNYGIFCRLDARLEENAKCNIWMANVGNIGVDRKINCRNTLHTNRSRNPPRAIFSSVCLTLFVCEIKREFER